MRRKMAKSTVGLIIGAALAVWCIGSTPNAAAADKLLIGFAHVNMNAPYYVAMQKTAEEVAKEENVELVWYNAEDDELKQVRQVMSMIGKGIKGLLINPVTPQGVKRAIGECVKQNIPIVAIDRQLYGDYIAYVGIDQWQAGYLVGEYIVKKIFPDKSKVVWVELQGSPGGPAAIGRGGGFHQALDQMGGGRFDLFYYDRGYYDRTKGMQIMEDAIVKAKGQGVSIDLVFGHNDSMVLGARESLKRAGLNDVILCGVDAQKEAVKLIIDSDKPQYVATIVNWSTDITRIGLKTLIEYIRTKNVPNYTSPDELTSYSKEISDPTKYIKTGTVLVDSGNAKDYYNPNAVF
ncbi:MAG: sugar ABC transporter substrate-binding protein [Desulfobacterales bacterium]|nr:MAG: sugar ABC transporter substrate-binding protein [Desulfobacterales bacterium]